MYSQEITRRHRTAFVLLVDRSASMQGRVRFGRTTATKAEAVAMIVNMLITELLDRCRRTDGLRNYYDVAHHRASGPLPSYGWATQLL